MTTQNDEDEWDRVELKLEAMKVVSQIIQTKKYHINVLVNFRVKSNKLQSLQSQLHQGSTLFLLLNQSHRHLSVHQLLIIVSNKLMLLSTMP
jgi:hypothetical protein